jgi:two-component system, NarL family, sensor kinase
MWIRVILLLHVQLLYCFFAAYAQLPAANEQAASRQQLIDEKRRAIQAANERKIDSLKREIARTPDDTMKVMQLIALSDAQSNDPEKAVTHYGEQARLLAKKLHFKRGSILADQSIGGIYQTRKDYAKAMEYYQEAIDLAEGNIHIIDNLHAPMLNLYFYLGDYPGAMKMVTEELVAFEKLKDIRGIAHCNNLLGYIYFKQENFPEAEKYYNRYVLNARQLNDSNLLTHALGEVADVYTDEGKYGEAFAALFRVVEICNGGLDSLYNVIRTRNNIGWLFPQYKSKAMYRLGRNYKLAGDLPNALTYARASVDYLARGGTANDYDSASYYIHLGDVYKELKDYPKAISYLRFGFEISKRIRHRENTRDAALYLSQTYEGQKNYDSAFFFYRLFTGLKDSIVNNNTKMMIAGIQGQYDVAQKDKKIFRQQQVKNFLIGGFILLLIILFLLYNRYRLRQNNRYQKELNRQQNELFNAIAVTQDQERKRIAEDIHDSLGSILSAAKLKLSSLKENQTNLAGEQLEKYQVAMQLLDDASAELRNISHNIMPATLSKLGLVAALRNLIGTISTHSGMQIDFSTHELTERLDEKTEMSIYRVVLELINNSVKHAGASKMTVQLIRYPDYINLTVEDNGRGFDYENELQSKKGIGLGNISSRVNYLSGKIFVDTSPGRGTSVIIDIPYAPR